MRATRLYPVASLAIVVGILPVIAHAHPGHDGHELTWDFSRGLVHPWTGWDHLLAMLAVGLWAAQLGGRARWLVPAAFVGMMTLGIALGKSGVIAPWIEPGIAASVFVLGLLLASASRVRVPFAMALVGFFAVFHGLAHGASPASTDSGLGYGVGLVGATLLLHAAGVGLGSLADPRAARATRLAGWVLAVSGLASFAV